MNFDYYKKFITDHPFRSDVTNLFENPKVFNNLINDLIKPFKKEKIDKIVALDALGFVLGGAIAYKLSVPLVLARKGGKLPHNKKDLAKVLFWDYTKRLGENQKKSIEIKKSSIRKGDKVLIVDEWIETGTQLKAVIKIVEKLGGQIIGISTMCADKNKKTKILFNEFNCRALKIEET